MTCDVWRVTCDVQLELERPVMQGDKHTALVLYTLADSLVQTVCNCHNLGRVCMRNPQEVRSAREGQLCRVTYRGQARWVIRTGDT